jgi:hypothetical protein
MAHTAGEHMQIRAHATECLGLLLAVEGSREVLGGHVPAFMQAALAGFTLNHAEARRLAPPCTNDASTLCSC